MPDDATHTPADTLTWKLQRGKGEGGGWDGDKVQQPIISSDHAKTTTLPHARPGSSKIAATSFFHLSEERVTWVRGPKSARQL